MTFEGVVGNDILSDIAIDDVEFQENTVCEKTAETLGIVLVLKLIAAWYDVWITQHYFILTFLFSLFSVKSKIVWISPAQTAELGGHVTLGCAATGRPTPRVVWKKDGHVLLEGVASANITIFSLTSADGGSYDCSAINIVANDTQTTAVNVKGKKAQVLKE